MRVCNVCKGKLPESAFGKLKASADGLAYRCRPCGVKLAKRYYVKATPDQLHQRRIARHGLTDVQFNQLLLKQRDACAICHQVTTLHIDHNHTCCPGEYSCGQCVRGLLCANCNRGLGIFSDSIDLLDQAKSYLRM